MTTEALVAHLRERRLDYRHALGILDSEYEEWRPEGKPQYRLELVGDAALLSFPMRDNGLFFAGVCQVLTPPTEDRAPDVAEAALRLGVNEVDIMGEVGFHALRPHIAEGRWFRVSQYGVSGGSLNPRPSPAVHRLTSGDAGAVERFCAADSTLERFRSTQREFGNMVQGLPVTCYGAFEGDDLVGICSANPVCRSVTEIGWLYVLEQHRRRGVASALLSVQVQDAFARGDAVGYYAGWEATSPWLGTMLKQLGFRDLLGQYRFIPAESQEEWRTWGLPVE